MRCRDGDFDFVAALTGDLTGLRVAYSPTLGFAEIAPDVAAIVADGVKLLEQLGAEVDLVEHVFDDPGEVLTTLMLPGVANAFRVFGFTAADKALMNPRLLESAEKGARIPVVEFLAAREKREQLGALMRSFHERYDILVTPARSLPAIGADEDRPSDPRYRNITELDVAQFRIQSHETAGGFGSGRIDGRRASGRDAGRGAALRGRARLRVCHAMEMARPFAKPDLDRARRFPVDRPVPRGIESMHEALSELAAA